MEIYSFMQGEDIFDGAIREVKEETGVRILSTKTLSLGSAVYLYMFLFNCNEGSRIVQRLLQECYHKVDVYQGLINVILPQ